jgi:hypothetical protein
LEEVVEKEEEQEEEEEEDQQGRVDRAFAAFFSKYKLDANIFASDEWDDVLEAINGGPINVLSFDAEPATLLARACIHRIQAAQGEEAA